MPQLILASVGGAAPAPAIAAAPAPAPTVKAAVAPAPKYPEGVYLFLGLVIFAISVVLCALTLPSVFGAHTPAFTPVDGISAFALFFLAATVVERLLEPFSSALVRATPQASAGDDGKAGTAGSVQAQQSSGALQLLGKTKAEALTRRASLIGKVVAGTSSDPATDTKEAAAEQATADQAVTNATFILWAVATLVAVPIVFYFGLSLPKALGVTAGTTPWFDQFLTAIVVGSGTKPLHDFFSNIQKSSQGGNSSTGGSSSS